MRSFTSTHYPTYQSAIQVAQQWVTKYAHGPVSVRVCPNPNAATSTHAVRVLHPGGAPLFLELPIDNIQLWSDAGLMNTVTTEWFPTNVKEVKAAIKNGQTVYAMIRTNWGPGAEQEMRIQICDIRIRNGAIEGKKLSHGGRNRLWVNLNSVEVAKA